MDKFKEAYQKLKFKMDTRGQVAQDISKVSIPEDWESFPNSSDQWVKIDLKQDSKSSAFMFKAKKGSVFPKHFSKNFERFIIMNPKGVVLLKTEKRYEKIQFPNIFVVNPNIEHLIEFQEDTEILCVLTPNNKTLN